MEGSVFFRFFAGVPMEGMDLFPLLPLGRWLFPEGIYLLMAGFYLGAERKNRRYAMVRYGSWQNWWNHYFWKHMRLGALAAAGLPCLVKAAEAAVSQNPGVGLRESFLVLALWTAHGMLFLALFLFMEIFDVKRMIPSALLLLEGMTFLYGFRCRDAARFMFGMWGMYAQSNFYGGEYGFCAARVIALEAGAAALCYLLGSCVLKKKGMEGVL